LSSTTPLAHQYYLNPISTIFKLEFLWLIQFSIGFGSGKPSEVTENHVAGVDSAVVQCGGAELKIELTCLKRDSPAKNPYVEPYGGSTSIAIRVWWDECVRITFDNRSYCICPPQSTPSQQQVMTQQQRNEEIKRGC